MASRDRLLTFHPWIVTGMSAGAVSVRIHRVKALLAKLHSDKEDIA